jgi:catechol 2,3-dioxygenase-like lactoylglutathione lyase family enzyme
MVYTLELDHIIVTVDDLDKAIEDYKSLGFRVMYGGKHASGTTHNALIPFSDGAYIELIALTGEEASDTDAEDFSNFFQFGLGSAGYALSTDDLDEDVADMKERGVQATDIREGSRELPDGRTIKWRIAHIDNRVFPLFLQDETPRKWRVPDNERRTRHENGVKGISQITFIIDDLHTGIARYRAVLGVPPQVDHHAAYFLLEDTLLHITVPMDGAMEDHLKIRRDAPYELKLKIHGDAMTGKLDSSKSHGLKMELVE